MFEYVLNRVKYDYKKQIWRDYGEIYITDTLEKALRAQALDRVLFDDEYEYYIEHRIKLDYGK